MPTEDKLGERITFPEASPEVIAAIDDFLGIAIRIFDRNYTRFASVPNPLKNDHTRGQSAYCKNVIGGLRWLRSINFQRSGTRPPTENDQWQAES